MTPEQALKSMLSGQCQHNIAETVSTNQGFSPVEAVRQTLMENFQHVIPQRRVRTDDDIERRINDQIDHITRPYRGMSDSCLYGMLTDLAKEANARYTERSTNRIQASIPEPMPYWQSIAAAAGQGIPDGGIT